MRRVDEEVPRQGGAAQEHPEDHAFPVHQADLYLPLHGTQAHAGGDEDPRLVVARAGAHAAPTSDARGHVDPPVALRSMQDHVEAHAAVGQLLDVLDVERRAPRARVHLGAQLPDPPLRDVHVLVPADAEPGLFHVS